MTEAKQDTRTAAERSIGTILEVARHMQYYVAPWQGLDLEQEAALSIREVVSDPTSPTFRAVLAIDPLLSKHLTNSRDLPEPSRLLEYARGFDQVHQSQLEATLKVSLSVLRRAMASDSAYLN